MHSFFKYPHRYHHTYLRYSCAIFCFLCQRYIYTTLTLPDGFVFITQSGRILRPTSGPLHLMPFVHVLPCHNNTQNAHTSSTLQAVLQYYQRALQPYLNPYLKPLSCGGYSYSEVSQCKGTYFFAHTTVYRAKLSSNPANLHIEYITI